jgi:hypothetical protein
VSDIRSLNLSATDQGLKVQELCRNVETLTAGSANTKEYFGFYVNTVGGAWSFSPIDGNTAISFTPTLNTFYNYHVSSITPHGSGTGHGNLGGHKIELVDRISTMTFSGTATTTSDILTVAIGDSATLTSDSAAIPLIGGSYIYEIVVDTFSAATTFTISYGGVDIYDAAGIGTYTGQFTATTADNLAIVIDTVATADIVVSKLNIRRA